jgi:hypothetical protein
MRVVVFFCIFDGLVEESAFASHSEDSLTSTMIFGSGAGFIEPRRAL